MTTLRLAWLFARRGAADRSTIVLPIVAFSIVTTLLLIVAGGAQAFFSWTDDIAPVYQGLAVIALALLVVPLIALGGSAARLSARRRDDRLAGLRLLGATPATVTALTVIESTLLAVAGALVGVVLSLALAPLVGLIPFRGEPLGMSILLGPGWIALAVIGVGALAALSAVIGLRRVVLSPLGVRTRQDAPRTHWVRVVIAVVVIGIVYLAMSALGGFGGVAVIIAVLGAGFGGAIAVLNLVGPWVLRMLASRQARRAQTPRRLLAARTILESPKAAWRQVSGVAMTSFMAVFAGVGVALIGSVGDTDPQSAQLVADIRTGVLITVIASFLMVACSAGVNQAAAILDRRDLYVSLDRLGMPVSEMNAARGRAVLSPLRITTVGSALVAGVVVFPLAGLSLIVAPASIAVIVGCLAAGIGLVWLALLATRPVLTRVLAEPSPSL
ncbi:FtsX-like permease family protein [Leifsonia sp. 71-9]|uniref:FtsX-like permease family protein n=1 Tax=Leifsonia sp. 71-9 TaxID=1895934 RepID=UPI00092A186D|nr:FtsX-like permease family protein [Leifsonia sp. 71-9]OJX72957.1 MAG: permease [Leifsonia sp. 71-9]